MPTRSFVSDRDQSLDETSEEGVSITSVVNSVLEGFDECLVGKAFIWQCMEHTRITLPYHLMEGVMEHTIVNVIAHELAEALGGSVELVVIRLDVPVLDATVLSESVSNDLISSTFSLTMTSILQLTGQTLMMKNGVPSSTQGGDGLSKTTSTWDTILSSYENTGLAWGDKPGTLTGLKVQLSGRLITEPSLPRTVVQTFSIGSFRSSNSRALQAGSYTIANNKGAYTIKVWLSQQA